MGKLQFNGDGVGTQTYRVCFCFLLAASEVKQMFAHYSDNGVMVAQHLRRFIEDVQDVKDGGEDAQAIIDSLKHLSIFHRRSHGFNLEAFFKYLFADDNLPINAKVHHDMTAPLSHYFIYTGHNSYLTGNQLNKDHLTPDLQAKAAEMINQTFGDILFAPGSECLKDFPSSKSLKKRVIISTKPPKEYLKAKDVKVKEGDLNKKKDEEAWGSEPNYYKNNKDAEYGDDDEEDTQEQQN
ncbi:phosphoinositide phospholipase C [Salvia divinorum]|uniref:Phosphoinositide phospholipase C n=1 Tax=Salvia divinorum TaxID=28513 RepID=A0ABD1GNU4_SALDI